MATQAQIEANRRNAQYSTGPRTPDGKAAVRQNAFRHGFCSGIPRMAGEATDDVQQLLAALTEENQPIGVNEEIFVYQMAEHFLFQQRASALLAEQLDSADQGEENTREVGLMLRYHTTAVRGFSKALHDLLKLQKQRKLQGIGFVPQEVEQARAETPVEAPTPPADAPKEATGAATQPVPPPFPVEPAAARPSQTRKSAEKEPAKQPHNPPKAA